MVSVSKAEDYLLLETSQLLAGGQIQETLQEKQAAMRPEKDVALMGDSETKSDVPGKVESDAMPQQLRIRMM